MEDELDKLLPQLHSERFVVQQYYFLFGDHFRTPPGGTPHPLNLVLANEPTPSLDIFFTSHIQCGYSMVVARQGRAGFGCMVRYSKSVRGLVQWSLRSLETPRPLVAPLLCSGYHSPRPGRSTQKKDRRISNNAATGLVVKGLGS